MTPVVERAPAKINLTLRVLGRRADGYHELDSLVAFAADAFDTVTLSPGPEVGVSTGGPFGGSIAGRNLIAVSLEAIARAVPGAGLGAVHLEKVLPVAAGIGGGSADAAAVIRAVQRANPGLVPDGGWAALAAKLGADVPVCLEARAQRMQGIGERLSAAPDLPPLAAVLVNPQVAVPSDKTAQVFRALAAGAAPSTSSPGPSPSRQGREQSAAPPAATAGRETLLSFMRAVGNDLTAPACSVVPAIGEVLAALEAAPGCRLAQLSGGGPTCFGIFDGEAQSEAAARRIALAHPSWWVRASRLV